MHTHTDEERGRCSLAIGLRKSAVEKVRERGKKDKRGDFGPLSQ